MQVRVISDIHEDINEKHSLTYNDDTFTIIAGDINGDPIKGVQWIKNNIKHGLFIHGNHCLVPDTEVLTANGFKYIKDITVTDKVYQYTKEGYCELVQPLRIIKNYTDKLIEFKSSQFHQIVTEEHRMCMSDNTFINAKDLLNKTLYSSDFALTANTKLDKDYNISDDMLRLLVWVICDSTIVLGERSLKKCDTQYIISCKTGVVNKIRIQFHLSKLCKINILSNLLNKLNIPFTLKKSKHYGCNILQPYFLRIYSHVARELVKLLNYKKEFPTWFLQLSKRQLDIILDTLTVTDGFKDHKQIKWTHVSKNDTDILQNLCVRHGYVFSYKTLIGTTGFYSEQLQYHCTIKQKIYRSRKIDINIINKSSDVYCLTVPSSAFIIRYKGITSITGNCVYNHLGLPIQQLQQIYSNAFPLEADVSYLNNQYKIINDIVFIGCCLYTDYKYNGTVNSNMKIAEKGLNDFRWGKILEGDKIVSLKPYHYLNMFKESYSFIKHILKKFKNKKCVLITHHCVSPLQLDPKYFTSSINASFVSDLTKFIEKQKNLALVVTGHTHSSSDIMIGNTRVICNPYGYRESEPNKNFNPNLIIDI